MGRLTLVDFFCGAGGFSEGFRQMGFDIVYGYDGWKPAIDTYNHNFGLKCEPKDILELSKSIENINKIPDTDVIIGSPPCVSFSTSNKSGKADKTLGIELIKAFLKIVAIKKFKMNSKLKAWFMENVPNSKNYIKKKYTFKMLNLKKWAHENDLSPNQVAIDLTNNSIILNSADYGSFQARKRLFSGEIIKAGKLIMPKPTHFSKSINISKQYKTIKEIKQNFPNPFEEESSELIKDVNYSLFIHKNEITDHFYDTGIYEIEWKSSRYLKENHPYMGKMSFPENENKPSRTITATKIANSRESIIYRSEINRKGNGEYRLPTVREAAIIMGFPITYQFFGNENIKWKLVGNAVSCSVSRSLALTVLSELGEKLPNQLILNKQVKIDNIPNLNTFSLKEFNNPPKKNPGAKFRRHPIKMGNITVTLSNYDIKRKSAVKNKWFTSIQYGTGKGFKTQNIQDNFYKKIEDKLKIINGADIFVAKINNGFSEKIADGKKLQEMYETQRSDGAYVEPTKLIDEIASLINSIDINEDIMEDNDNNIFQYKKTIPTKQLLALYAVNKISSIANNK